jgi:hypothetical protein
MAMQKFCLSLIFHPHLLTGLLPHGMLLAVGAYECIKFPIHSSRLFSFVRGKSSAGKQYPEDFINERITRWLRG